MSLIKMAGIGKLTPLGFAPGILAAKSGNPLKWLFQRKPIRQHISQPIALSTFSNSVNRIRQGYTTDSTKLPSAILDAQMGQAMNLALGAVEYEMKNKGLVGKFTRRIVDNSIDYRGKYNIPKIEEYMRMGKKADNILNHMDKHPLSLYGATLGGGVGALKKDDEGHISKKNIVRGAIAGGTLGFGVGKGVKKFKGITTHVAKLHDNYFKDNYWHDQLHRANENPIYRSIGVGASRLFTSPEENRLKRIARFENVSNYLDKDVKDVGKDIKRFLVKPRKLKLPKLKLYSPDPNNL